MHPTEVLMQEHRVIERMLDALEAHVCAAQEGQLFPRQFFDEALDFFRNFADGCHHAKEEKLLFPAMVLRGIPQEGGPIGVMLADHVQGRLYLGAIRDHLDAAGQGSPEALRVVYSSATHYIQMLRQHIVKEDRILFHMANLVLEPEDVGKLQLEFDAVAVPERFQEFATR